MTSKEEAELIAEVDEAKAKLRTSLKRSKALIAAYRARLVGIGAPDADDPEKRPLFRFKRPD